MCRGSLARRSNWNEKAESWDYGSTRLFELKLAGNFRLQNEKHPCLFARGGTKGKLRSSFRSKLLQKCRKSIRPLGIELRTSSHLHGQRFIRRISWVLGFAWRQRFRREWVGGFLSSISAYKGCYSAYGKAKLAVEQEFLPRGVRCMLPGLLRSDKSKGMFGKLARAAGTLHFLALVDGGKQKLAFSQAENLDVWVVGYCQGGAESPLAAQITAYPEFLTFRKILEGLAEQAGRSINFFASRMASTRRAGGRKVARYY